MVVTTRDQEVEMAGENSRFSPLFPWEGVDPIEQSRQRALLELMRSNQRALWLLADYELPPDVREIARVWKLEQTVCEIWRNAFIQGWRACNKESFNDRATKETGRSDV